MRLAGLLGIPATLLLTTAAIDAPAALPFTPAVSCEALADVDWSGFSINSAESVPAGDREPAHCKVQGTIDTEINFELLMPLANAWNGRFVMGGGGGYVGSVQNQAIQFSAAFESPLMKGFATVGTDTGHEGSGIDASWALDREDREVNFGHRAVHMTTQTAKTLIRHHYGDDIDYSYFVGCSRGGGQAMMASQRFPDDFDGIVSIAPAFSWPAIGAQFVQVTKAMYPDPTDLSAPTIGPEHRNLLEATILEACDALDGISDGILNDPRTCPFTPKEDLPRCEGADGDACFTDAQIEAIEVVYGGAQVDGRVVHPGFPFGGESEQGGWGQWVTGAANAFGPGTPSLHYAFGTQMFKYLVYDDPDWNYAEYDFGDWRSDTRPISRVLDARNPDLTPFEVGGGKLLFAHGWSDAALTANATVEYFEAVQAEHENADDFVRLFMMPGVLHCSGGPGPDQVDWLAAIQEWVESGEAPEELTATKFGAEGEALMERPLCAYPARAEYDGSGDPNRPESFACVTP